MSINSNYLFVVNMDIDADKEALFNEIYDNEHIPNLLKVPGVRAVTRMAGEPFAMSIGGAEKQDTMCLSPLFRRAAVDKASRPSLRISFVRCGCLSR